MSSMLEQALVDATALKEAALKKAEAAVLEAAKPKIEETLKALLEAEGDELEDLLGDDELGVDPLDDPLGGDPGPGEVGGVMDNLTMGITAGEKMCACPDEEEEIEIDFGELERQMAADEQGGEPGTEMGQDDLAADLNLSPPDDELGAEMGQDDQEDEFDIDEEYLAEEIASALKEEEECDEEVDPVEEAKMTRDMIAAASADAHRDYKRQQATATPEKERPRHKSLGQEFDLDTGDDAPLELAEGEMIVTKEKLMEIVNSHTKDLFTSQAKKDKEIEKLKSYLLKLTEQVKETNLSNARLLYTNQTLESVSLNERQKSKIVEAVSKAGSVEEAKVIYETLIVSVGSSSSNDRKKPKSLREAVERRSTPLIARGNKPEKVSNDPIRARMRELAGIKK